MLRLSKSSRSTNDAGASCAYTAGCSNMSTVANKWHTKPQKVGADNGATRLTPEIVAPKGDLAAEHRRNTAFSLLLTVTWRDARVKIRTEAFMGLGPSAGHPIREWGRLPPPAFDQHSGRGRNDLRLNTHRAPERNERSAVSATSSREKAFESWLQQA